MGKNNVPFHYTEKQRILAHRRAHYLSLCTKKMVFIVFASDDVLVAKQRVMMAKLCDSKLAYRHRAMTAARKLEERKHQ